MATDFFTWNVDNNPSIGSVYWTGANTTKSADTSHSGTYSMKFNISGTNQDQMGCEFGDYDMTTVVGGPSIYYRWWMKIMPGFNWGNADAKMKSSRTNVGSAVGYTGYLMSYGFLIGECTPGGCTLQGGGSNSGDYGLAVSYDLTQMDDGQWHEYILRIKGNTTNTSMNAEFEAWVDGVQVGFYNNFTLHSGIGVMNERWGGWMERPLPQFNDASAGGIIYVDDFATSNYYNSLLGGPPPPPPINYSKSVQDIRIAVDAVKRIAVSSRVVDSGRGIEALTILKPKMVSVSDTGHITESAFKYVPRTIQITDIGFGVDNRYLRYNIFRINEVGSGLDSSTAQIIAKSIRILETASSTEATPGITKVYYKLISDIGSGVVSVALNDTTRQLLVADSAGSVDNLLAHLLLKKIILSDTSNGVDIPTALITAKTINVPDSGLGLDSTGLGTKLVLLADAGYGFDIEYPAKVIEVADIGAGIEGSIIRYLELMEILDSAYGNTTVNVSKVYGETKIVILETIGQVIEEISINRDVLIVVKPKKVRRLIYRIRHS